MRLKHLVRPPMALPYYSSAGRARGPFASGTPTGNRREGCLKSLQQQLSCTSPDSRHHHTWNPTHGICSDNTTSLGVVGNENDQGYDRGGSAKSAWRSADSGLRQEGLHPSGSGALEPTAVQDFENGLQDVKEGTPTIYERRSSKVPTGLSERGIRDMRHKPLCPPDSSQLFPVDRFRRSLYSTASDGLVPASDQITDTESALLPGGSHHDSSEPPDGDIAPMGSAHEANLSTPDEETVGSDFDTSFGNLQNDLEDAEDDPILPPSVPEPLPYRIPEDVLAAAIESQDFTNPTQWTHELYRGPSDRSFPPLLPVYYCKKLQDSERVAKLFLDESYLGFDLEWASIPGVKRTIKRDISVFQLASPTKIAIFHIALHDGDTIEQLLAPSLKEIMESPNIIKTGVAIKGDCTRLRNHLGIQSVSMMELSHLHKLVKFGGTSPALVNRRLVALKDLVYEHLQLPLAKGEVRTSAWDHRLTMEQQKYAAADAYASVALFDILERKRLLMRPCPPRPEMAETNLPISIPKSKKKQEKNLEDVDEDPMVDVISSLSQDVAATTLADERVNITLGLADPDIDPHIGPKVTKRSRVASMPSKSTLAKEPPPPELQQANVWVEEYNAFSSSTFGNDADPVVTGSPTDSRNKPRASNSQLRAYALWHHQAHSCDTAAQLLNIKPSTVAVYTLQAVHYEVLPFEEDRLKELAKETGFVPYWLKMSKVVGRFVA